MPQISIRLDEDSYQWLIDKVSTIRPETTINKYINWLLEKERNHNRLTDTKRPYNITNSGQIEGNE